MAPAQRVGPFDPYGAAAGVKSVARGSAYGSSRSVLARGNLMALPERRSCSLTSSHPEESQRSLSSREAVNANTTCTPARPPQPPQSAPPPQRREAENPDIPTSATSAVSDPLAEAVSQFTPAIPHERASVADRLAD